MKELYSFEVKKKIKEKVPFDKENKKGEIVQAFKTKTSTVKKRVIFAKPSFADVEEADFFYGQKYNEFINSGYLTRLMLNKKIGDIGGASSKIADELIQKAFLDNMEAAKVVEFYEGQKNLDKDQEQKLEDARDLFIKTQRTISEYEDFHRSQYNQTAEAKAEQKIIEWFIFNFSFYEDEVNGNKSLFGLFDGDNYEEKRSNYLTLCEDEEDIEDKKILKNKFIFDESFSTLVKVANIWYNKMGSNQEEIDEALKQIFPDE